MARTGLIGAGRSHLAEAGMDYAGHLVRATRIGSRLIVAGGACLVHGILPGLFVTKGSDTILKLHEEIAGTHKRPADRMWLEFEI